MAHVNDGTSDKGRRVVKAAAQAWVCKCGSPNRHYWVNCPKCSNRRPEN
jgi:hypothetical protein